MKQISHLLLAAMTCTVLYSCQKDKALKPEVAAISEQTIASIAALGFSTADVKVHDEGFLVEGDIVITQDMLTKGSEYQLLRIAEEEQYRTTYLVRGLPRRITIRVSTALPARYITAVNNAILRYNALNLRVTFSRVTSGGNIVISKAPSS
eukprot:gene65201-89211_t